MSTNGKPSIPPQIQAIHDVFGRHIRYYPQLTAAFGGNQNCAIVFAEFLYQDGLRLARKAAFFTLTDKQLSERCGIGVDQTMRAREYICGPGILLFLRERHGSPPINHYAAQYERIYAWLEAVGIGKPKADPEQIKLWETGSLNLAKPQVQTSGNRHSFNNLFSTNDVDDARLRARAISLDQFLESINIENPTRTELVSGLMHFDDGLAIAKDISERTTEQLLASQKGGNWMRSGSGMVVSRIRAIIKERRPTPVQGQAREA